MNTSVEKNSKKRKSVGGPKGTPAKAAKINESMQSPKLAKSPKVENKAIVVESNNVVAKSPKKQIKPENKIVKSENGVSPKLKKFKGTKSIEQNGDKKPKEKKEKKRRPSDKSKKSFLLEKMQARVVTQGKEAVVKDLNKSIDSIASKTELTKSAKRMMRLYKHILKEISGEEFKTTPHPTKPQVAVKKQNEKKTTLAAKGKVQGDKKMPVLKAEVKVAPKQNKKAASEDAEEESDDDDIESSFKDVKKAEFEDDSAEDSDDDEEVSGEEDDGSDDEEEEDDGSDDEEEEDEESDEEGDEKPAKKVEPKKVIETKNVKPQQKKNENTEKPQKKSRYVLFIGNLAYDTSKDELKEHFKKVGEVVDVRIPTDKESNRPRGFAYVELVDEAAYKKSLDLNGSQLKNRKIKVEYTQEKKEGEDRSKGMKAKNFKLHAMRKQGQKGSPNKGFNKGSPFKGRNKK